MSLAGFAPVCGLLDYALAPRRDAAAVSIPADSIVHKRVLRQPARVGGRRQRSMASRRGVSKRASAARQGLREAGRRSTGQLDSQWPVIRLAALRDGSGSHTVQAARMPLEMCAARPATRCGRMCYKCHDLLTLSSPNIPDGPPQARRTRRQSTAAPRNAMWPWPSRSAIEQVSTDIHHHRHPCSAVW